MPYIKAAGELKTKPTQHSVRELAALGIKPDILLCRAEHPIPESDRRKIAQFCNVRAEAVIQALDAPSIYAVPQQYHAEGLDREVLRAFGITDAPAPDLSAWEDVTDRHFNPEGEVTIAVVGKYVGLQDAYKSLNEALVHGGLANRVKVNIRWIDAEIFEGDDDSQIIAALEPMHGILVPGGFGERAARARSRACASPRAGRALLRDLPRDADGLHRRRARGGLRQGVLDRVRPDRHARGRHHHRMDEQGRPPEPRRGRRSGGHDAARRYPAKLSPNSHTSRIYGGAETISERHRHRYEVNSAFIAPLEQQGLIFAGMSPDGLLPEIVERPDHPGSWGCSSIPS